MKTIRFDGRTAIVTGAGGGLGREYALELARRGAHVVVNDLGVSSAGKHPSSEMADRVVAEILSTGGKAVSNYDDVGTRAGGEALVKAAVEAFGRLDIVIINAGLVRTMRFEDQTDEQIDTILNVNLKQGFYVGQPAYRVMKEQGYGRFVFMGSAVGMFGDGWQANYGASKAGLFALSNIIALEGAKHGILSNVVTPTARSRMEEQLNPLSMEEVPEIARMASAMSFTTIQDQLIPIFNTALSVYLASEKCQSTHGVYSSVGGRYARISVGVGQGWRADGGRLPTVEDVDEHWAEITDDKIVGRPQHVMDEIRMVIDGISDPTRS